MKFYLFRRYKWTVSDEAKATHIKVKEVYYAGSRLTVGKIYSIQRDFSNPLFERGEAYVIDDNGSKNYAVWLICSVSYLK